jgi:hypothetical protein
MVWIAGSTLASSASIYTFSSIPQTFTHLQIRAFGRTDRPTYNVGSYSMTINGDTGNNYSRHYMRSVPASPGTSVDAGGGASVSFIDLGQFAGSTATSGILGCGITDILDYTNTNKNTTVRHIGGVETNGAASGVAGFVQMSSGAWFNTNAVTSLSFYPIEGASNFVAGTRFDLYGITSSQVTGA